MLDQMSTITNIKFLENKRKKLIAKLMEEGHMLRGSFGINYRRCGKPTCWCANAEKGHPFNRITWMRNARSFSKVIPEHDVPWIKEVTQKYRDFKSIRKQIRELDEKLILLLDELEDEKIEKTEQLKAYL
jgi:hypothetical protein